MPIFNLQEIKLYQVNKTSYKGLDTQIKLVKLSDLNLNSIKNHKPQDSSNPFDNYCFINEIYQ